MFGSRRIEIKVEDELNHFNGQRLRSTFLQSHHYANSKKVSFCSVLKSTDQFLFETLPKNLQANHRDRTQVEFVVLVPIGWQGLTQLKDKFKYELESSYLKIATYPNNANERALRNLCFQLAEGLILVNLESAHFTGQRAGNFIFQELTSDIYDHVLWFKQKGRAPSRMACWRDTFYEIGGFDEEKEHAGQCSDLLDRLNDYGVESIMRSNDYFTKSLQKEPRRFFNWKKKKKVRKLKMSRLDERGIVVL